MKNENEKEVGESTDWNLKTFQIKIAKLQEIVNRQERALQNLENEEKVIEQEVKENRGRRGQDDWGSDTLRTHVLNLKQIAEEQSKELKSADEERARLAKELEDARQNLNFMAELRIVGKWLMGISAVIPIITGVFLLFEKFF